MRKDARELAFKMIYSDLFKGDEELSFDVAKENLILNDEDDSFYKEIYNSYVDNKEDVKAKVLSITVGYEEDRIYKIDLALIYLAVSEITYIQTPAPIVINEVVNLAKKYSTDKSQSFINGVLAKFVK